MQHFHYNESELCASKASGIEMSKDCGILTLLKTGDKIVQDWGI